MKVCFIAGTLGRGGAERQLLYMLRALRDVGIESRVLCLTRGESFEAPIRDLGIEVEWVGTTRSRIIRMLTIINNIRRRPVDIVQSAHFYTNLYAAAAARSLGISSIGAIRSDLTYELGSNKAFGQLQLRLPCHLISNSQLALNRVISEGINEKKTDLVRNVVETPSYIELNGGNSNGIVNILFAGRLSIEKRPDLFVEMAIQIMSKLPQVPLRFGIAGDGPMRDQLERRLLNCGQSGKKIEFYGYLNEMSHIYLRTDLLVLTSDHEGTPNVVLEAMAYGIPVIATRVGGIPAILGRECGFLVEPGCLEGLVSKAAELIKDPALRRRFGGNGRRFVRDYHSFANLGNRLTKIYAKLMREDRANGNI